MDQDLVVIVTGGARGIGRGVVEAVLAAGYVAVAVDLDEAALDRLREELRDRPGRLEAHPLDVTDRGRVRAVFDPWPSVTGASTCS